MSSTAGDPAHASVLLDAAPAALLLAEEDGTLLFVNEELENLFGYAPGELPGKRMEQLLPPGDGAPRLALGLVSGRKKDGTLFPVQVVVRRRRTDGRIRLAALVRDVSDRVRQFESLQQELKEARAVFEDAAIGMAVTTLDGRILRVNEALATMLGYAPQELAGRPVPGLTHPDDRGPGDAEVREVLEGRRSRAAMEKRYVRRDGSVLEALLHASLVRDAHGKPRHFVSQVQDIGGMRRSERRLQEFFDRAPDGVFVADREGRLTEVNAAACRMLALPRETLLGMRVADLLAPGDASRFAAFLTGHPAHDSRLTEWRFRAGDGREVPVELSSARLPDGTFQAFARDVTERDEAQAELVRTRALLDAVFDQSPVGLRLRETRGGTQSNRRFLEMMARLPAVREDGPAELSLPDGRAVTYNDSPISRAMRGELVDQAEYRLHTDDGRVVPVLISARRISRPGGEPIGTIATVEDISRYKEQERLRAGWERAIAGELGTPVENLRRLATRLRTLRGAADPELQELASGMEAQLAGLGRMLSDLDEGARLALGEAEVVRQPVNLAELVRTAARRLEAPPPKPPLELRVPSAPCLAEADPTRLAPALERLVSAARDAAAPGTAVEIAVSRGESTATVAISHQPAVASDPRDDAPATVGGLAIHVAHGLAEALGGRLSVERRADGRTSVLLRLPVRFGSGE